MAFHLIVKPAAGPPITLPLHDSSSGESVFLEGGERVFEDGEYEIDLQCPLGSFHSPRLLLLGEEIGSVTKEVPRIASGLIRFQLNMREDEGAGMTQKPKPFLLSHDWINLSVVEKDDPDNVWTSDFFPCLCKNDGFAENLSAIVKTLVDPDETEIVISEWMSRGRKTDSNERDASGGYVRGSLRVDRPKSLDGFIGLIRDVIDCYAKQYAFFRNRASHKIDVEPVLVPFSKVRSVSISDFQWLMQNAERLAETNAKTGITHRGKHYLPDRMRATRKRKQFDFFENRCVVAFLRFVIGQTEGTRYKLAQLLETSRDIGGISFGGDNGYVMPLGVVKRYQNRFYEKKKETLDTLVRRMGVLLRQYESVLAVSEMPIRGLPRMTKMFQEIEGYRIVYDTMRKWFRFGEFALVEESRMLCLKQLDKLFEYYSLHVLLDLFRRQGFRLGEDAGAIRFPYDFSKGSGRIDIQENETEINNTYRLVKENRKVTIYFQGGIFNPCRLRDKHKWDEIPNGINLSLIRSRSGGPKNIEQIGLDAFKDYVTPDFILKICDAEGKERYVILDSKFSDLENIKKFKSAEMFFKYVHSIRPSNRFNEGVVSLILLQGRTKPSDLIYRFQGASFVNAIDYRIVPLSSRSETADALWDVLKNLL